MKYLKISVIAVVLLLALVFSGCGAKFNLNFIVDGEVYEAVRTRQNKEIELPKSPTKDNYTFDGWYLDKDIWQKPFDSDSLLGTSNSDDINVYAKWRPNIVKIEFDLAGGSLSLSSINAHYGEKIGALPTPTKPYYVFTGWVDKNGNPITIDTPVTEDMTCITATWKLNLPQE